MSHLSHFFSGLDVTSEGWSKLFKITWNLFPPLWERSQICFEGKDDGPPDCLASPFTVILLGSLSPLQGIPLGSVFWQAILNRDQIFKEDFTHSDSHSPSPHNRAMFCKFREGCFHFGQKHTWSKFCTVCYNVGWVQISQRGYDRKIRQAEQAFRNVCSSKQQEVLILGDFGFYLADLSHVCVGEIPSEVLDVTAGCAPVSSSQHQLKTGLHSREAYSQTGSHNLSVRLAPWL